MTIAWSLGLDPLDVRLRNLYGPGRDMTPYGMQVTDNVAPEMIDSAGEVVRLSRAARSRSRPSMTEARSSSAASR